MRRRLLITLAVLTVGGLLALGTLPWWAGPVLKKVTSRYGVTVARYERMGYGRFAVSDVTYRRANVTVHVARAETQTPVLWALHRWFGQPAEVVASDWRVDVTPTANANPASASSTSGTTASGAMPLRATLFKVARILDRWLPRAKIGAGTVTWKDGELRIDQAQWEQRSLTVWPLRYGAQAGEVRATFTKNDELLLEAHSVTALSWQASLKSVRDEISGEARVWDQPAAVSAQFAPQSWMPRTMEVRAEHWAIPAAELKLGASYATVRADARLAWREGHFETSAEFTGEVAPDRKAPPLAAKLHARGDTEQVTIDSLAVDVPGVNAQLSAPAVFSRKPDTADAISHFTLAMDLEKQPWIPDARGHITGRAQLTRIAGKIPLIEGEVQAADVKVREWTVARFNANATLDWPHLNVRRATLGFAEGGELAVHGRWDLRANEILEAGADGVLRRSVVAHWLPEKMQFESVTLAARAHGPVMALEHEGTARVAGFVMPPVNPLAADLAWRGKATEVEVSEGRVQAGASQLTLAGTFARSGAHLEKLRLEQNGTERFSLKQPTAIAWSPRFEVTALHLNGPEASVALTGSAGGNAGEGTLAIRNFSSAWLTDFVSAPGPAWQLTTLEAQGKWQGGAAEFSLRTGLQVTLAPGRFANLTMAARGNGDGIEIEALRAAEGDSAIVDATGHLPVAIVPGGAALVHWEKDSPLALHARTASNPDFWKKLTEATGLEFQEPEVSVDLAGTWEKPQGTMAAKARRVAADAARIKFAFPTVEALDIHATADGAGIVVDRFAVKVEGQDVRASGQLPLTLNRWADFKKAPVDFLRREGDLHLEIPEAEIAAFARYTGQYLAPSGRLHVDMTLRPGGEMTGALQLRDAATRPLGPLGVLQEIQADAQWVGRSLEIKSVTARGGGQPVTLTGKVQLPLGAGPKFDLALVGDNFPLVRQTGLLMRADLELKLVTEADDATVVSGAVRLRDSMFLSDIRALIPKGGGGGPARRPPFFAIENPPLNAWRLAVDVRGEEFLRLRSAVFAGAASARFHLGGTLGEPRAVGEATVDSGQVLLPFATFRVEQGTVRLTEADPYALGLFLSGTSRRYGYDLRMEITGTAADPVVAFSSSPPLEAKQVLLMVTAGELPRDEITYGGAQRAARLGTYLGQSLINNFGGDATDTDRLNISTGERVSRQGRETYNIEYRLNDRFTVVGEYDEFDAYNAGVKWQLFAPEKAAKKAAMRAKENQEVTDGPRR